MKTPNPISTRFVGALTLLALLSIDPPAAFASQKNIDEGVDEAFTVDERGPDHSPAHGRTIGLSFVRFDGTRFSIDSKAVIVRLNCAHFCPSGTTRELRATDAGHVQATNDIGGDHRSTAYVNVPVTNDIPWGIYRAELLHRDRIARSESGGVESVPKLFPQNISIPTGPHGAHGDANLLSIRKEYVGKTVQGFGDIALDCDSNDQRPLNVGNEPSLVISRVDRPFGPARDWKLGGPVENRWEPTIISSRSRRS